MSPYRRLMVSHPQTGRRIQVLEHVYIWLLNAGLWQQGVVATPKGMHVHHVDFDTRNNDVKNLLLISDSDHLKLHYDHDAKRRARIGESLRANYRKKTPEERKARIGVAQLAASEKRRREGPTPKQLEAIARARTFAYGGARVKK